MAQHTDSPFSAHLSGVAVARTRDREAGFAMKALTIVMAAYILLLITDIVQLGLAEARGENLWETCKNGPCFGLRGQKFGLCMQICLAAGGLGKPVS